MVCYIIIFILLLLGIIIISDSSDIYFFSGSEKQKLFMPDGCGSPQPLFGGLQNGGHVWSLTW